MSVQFCKKGLLIVLFSVNTWGNEHRRSREEERKRDKSVRHAQRCGQCYFYELFVNI